MNILKKIELNSIITINIAKSDENFVLFASYLIEEGHTIIGRTEMFPIKYFTYQFVEDYIPTFIKPGAKKKDLKDYCMNLITVVE